MPIGSDVTSAIRLRTIVNSQPFDPLRSNLKFKELLHRIGLPA